MKETTEQDYNNITINMVPLSTKSSIIVSNKKCSPKMIVIYANGADGSITIYNGINTDGAKFITIPVLNGKWDSISFPDGTCFDKGMYIVLSASTMEVSILFN